MEFNETEVREALEHPQAKAAKKLLADLSEKLHREEPQFYTALLKRNYENAVCATAQRRYRFANAVATIALMLAFAAVICAYVLGDFGTAILTGWGYCYLLAAVVLFALGLLVLAGSFSSHRRAVFVATVLLHQSKEENKNEDLPS